ncbi:unnamed protein product [Alternaria alternata]
MRLFILLITFLSAVAALALNKIDGTTIELGDEPAVVDLSNVIIPARAPVTESSAHNARDATDVNAADWDRSASNSHYRAILNSLRHLPRRTGHCEPTARSLFLHGSVGNLATNPATIGWNDKIKSVDCRWDQL